jgi:hypothetical protein
MDSEGKVTEVENYLQEISFLCFRTLLKTTRNLAGIGVLVSILSMAVSPM